MTRMMKWFLAPAALLIGLTALPASQANAGWGVSIGGYPYGGYPYGYANPYPGGYYPSPYAAYPAPYPYYGYRVGPSIGLSFGGYGGYGGYGYRPYYGGYGGYHHHYRHW